MNATRRDLFLALEALTDQYPELRLGQLIVNISNLATRIPDGIWDVEDHALLDDAREHLKRITTLNHGREAAGSITSVPPGSLE